MSIDTIYIPTYGRLNRQLTYDSMGEELQSRVKFVLVDFEVEPFSEKYGADRVLECPEQGKPEPMAAIRKWIAERAREREEKYAVFDDDILGWWYRSPAGQQPSSRKMDGAELAEVFDTKVSPTLDEYTQVGFTARNKFPAPESAGPLNIAAKQFQVFFFNGKTYPVDDIEWFNFRYSDDLYFTLQLVMMGMPNAIFRRYTFAADLGIGPGGCEAAGRNDDKHNECIHRFIQTYPAYAKLLERSPRHGLQINYKKALKDYKASTLEKFV